MFVRMAAIALSICALAAPAKAEYPDHAIKMIVPFAAGGGTDVLARIIAQNLNSKWGQPVVVENQPGASGAIGSRAVMNAAPDGYTLLMASTGALMAVSSGAESNGPFDVNQVLTPIADVLEHFSRYVVFEPGDLIAMGAPSGVAVGQPNADELYLRPGDDMVIGFEGLMSLRTRIVAPN
jgi:tripartite-type tricarboxylate transporter receptor subunit TctC